MAKRIVLTGGGTAGHVTPNLALVPKLIEEGYEVIYIGSHKGIEKSLVEEKGIEYHSISSGKLRRQLSLKNVSDGFRVIKGMIDAKKLLKELKPDIVFSKGGFVTVPVIYAAKSLGIPTVIHESDLTPGLANRLSSKKSDRICCSFEKTLDYLPKDKSERTGLPIRQELLSGDPLRAIASLGIKNNNPVILVMGGSLGAVAINSIIHENIETIIEKYNIIHICGKGKANDELNGKDGYYQFEYVGEELPDYLALADVVISRAGANAISELLALHKLNILIPLSKAASRGDQILNAKEFVSKGYSVMIEEEMLNLPTLMNAIMELRANKEIYINKMKENNSLNTIDRLVEIFNELTTDTIDKIS